MFMITITHVTNPPIKFQKIDHISVQLMYFVIGCDLFTACTLWNKWSQFLQNSRILRRFWVNSVARWHIWLFKILSHISWGKSSILVWFQTVPTKSSTYRFQGYFAICLCFFFTILSEATGINSCVRK